MDILNNKSENESWIQEQIKKLKDLKDKERTRRISDAELYRQMSVPKNIRDY